MAEPMPRRHAYPKVTSRDHQTYLAGTEVTRIKSLLREMRYDDILSEDEEED